MSKNIITDFTYGEISRKTDGRSDLGAYYKSCAELLNMYVTPQGVASRMPGTEFISAYLGAVTNYDTVRIIPFWIDENDSYMLVFSTAHLWYLKLGTTTLTEIKDSSNNALTLTKKQINEFQYVQFNDKLFFCHQGIQLKKITYTAGTPPSFVWANATEPTGIGHAGAITAMQQRLILGNFSSARDVYAVSESGNPEGWTWGTTDSSPFKYQLSAGRDYSAIRWLAANEDGLVAGTATSEVVIPGGTAGITPSNGGGQRLISCYGSCRLQAVKMGLSLLFVGRTGERLREYAFTGAEGATNSPDLTVLADDILEGGVKQMCFQNSPFECLFVLRNDGTVCMFTYDRDTGISAWSRLDLGGEVESIATAPGEGQDYTYLIVKRMYGSTMYRYIERFTEYSKPDKRYWKYVNSCATINFGNKAITGYSIDADTGVITVTCSSHGLSDADFIKIDGIKAHKDYGDGVYYDAPCELNGRVFRIADSDTNTFTLQTENFKYIDGSSYAEYVSGGTAYILSKSVTGLVHLQGRLCSIVADGGVQADRTVDGSGNVTIERLANIVQVGLPYTSHIKTNRLVPNAMGEVKRIYRVHIRFYRSLGCLVSSNLKDEQAVSFRENELNLESPGVYTGDKSISLADDYNTDGYIYLIQKEPLPFNICAVGIDYKTGGR